MHVGVGLDAGHFDEGGRKIDVLHEGVRGGGGLGDAGPANDKWRPKGFFVHPSFVIPTVFSEKESLVRGVNDDGIVG